MPEDMKKTPGNYFLAFVFMIIAGIFSLAMIAGVVLVLLTYLSTSM